LVGKKGEITTTTRERERETTTTFWEGKGRCSHWLCMHTVHSTVSTVYGEGRKARVTCPVVFSPAVKY
jgi:hypothetical protein